MMRWPWTHQAPDPATQRERDREIQRVAELRRRAEQLTERAERVAAELEFVLAQRRNGKARGM